MKLNVNQSVDKVVPAVLTEFDHNLYHLPPDKALTFDSGAESPDAARWRMWGYDRSSLFADPKLKNPANGDYSLTPGSPALKLGFKPIDQSRIGLLTPKVGAGQSSR
jgi:hypothetical protein